MKDITLKIIGKQSYDDMEEEQMEFVTDGRLYVRGGSAYIIYDESEVSGLAGCKTTISVYETPYGPMGIEVLTDRVQNSIDMEKGSGCIDVEYQVSMEGLAEGRNRITIEIM